MPRECPWEAREPTGARPLRPAHPMPCAPRTLENFHISLRRSNGAASARLPGATTMTDPNWEEQFRQFLRKTGDDFRRAGDEVRAEAQRLLEAAMDPEKQQRV